ncbi:MAG: hypothetical protein LUG95_08340 [Clostridiales bacterium]|nr:hypothetical protein [Clostridiales bacterium]
MDAIKSYRKNIIIKSIVIPVVVTLLALFLFHYAEPYIEQKLPNAEAYSYSESTEADADE